MPRPRKSAKPARQKILDAALRLFYEAGYHDTGVNRIIAESGVSKATFYAHFPSKESLCVAYLRALNERDLEAMKDALYGIADPLSRYLAIVGFLEPWLRETNLRGCAFSNIAVEVTDPSSPVRKEVRFHEDNFRAIIRDAVEDLVTSDATRYRHLNSEEIADEYYLIVEGAISICRHYHDTWPMRKARRAVARLLR